MENYIKIYQKWINSEELQNSDKNELLAIAGNDNEIKERFGMELAFGTAGMRGVLGMGTNRMNVFTVRRATKGLADYISGLGSEAMKKGVVIAYDTRRFSVEFAAECAGVLAANKINCYIFEDVRPVPMCSFAVRHLGATAGIMITASHNPKQYNGYKVYGADGAQMSPEATAVVVGFIDKTDYFGIELADVKTTDRSKIKGKDNYELGDYITVIGKSLDEDYYAEISKLSLSPEAVAAEGAKMKLVYSPIHGSGYVPVTTMLSRMGIKAEVVEEQKNPDTEFSTVVMPNPEQPDALALGIKLADKISADVVIGTDPDCDRMGVAVRDDKGVFTLLTGNQIGALLLDYILLRHKERGDLPANGAVVKTIVTTSLADKIARSYGMTVYDVLTGFKFIGEKIKEWEGSGKHTFMFGYEESYGYLSGTHARDKDAVVASMLFAEMVCYYQYKGKKLYDRLQEIFATYGYFAETSKSFAFKGLDGMQKMSDIMEKARAEYFTDFAGIKTVSKLDFKKRVETFADGRTAPITLPETNVIKYTLGNDEWVCIRPSGTEPKLKVYVSVNAKTAKEADERRKAVLEAAESKLL